MKVNLTVNIYSEFKSFLIHKMYAEYTITDVKELKMHVKLKVNKYD